MTTRDAVAEVTSREEELNSECATTSQPALDRPSVRETLTDIFADSRNAPRQYIDETISPLGGE